MGGTMSLIGAGVGCSWEYASKGNAPAPVINDKNPSFLLFILFILPLGGVRGF